MENDISKVLTNDDVSALLTSFPDLKETLSVENGSKIAGIFLNSVADHYGLKENRLQLLEFLATTAAMKLRAKIALGEELQTSDTNNLVPEFRDLAIKKSEIYKEKLNTKSTQTSNNGTYTNITGTTFRDNNLQAVDKKICEDIRDINFETAIHLLPIKIRLQQQWDENLKLPSNHPEKISEEDMRCVSLNQISGNESGQEGCNLRENGFKYTLSQRLVAGDPKDPHWREGKDDDHGEYNNVFQSFSALYITANAIQAHAHIALGKTFPSQIEHLKNNHTFFYGHAPEALATCIGYKFKDTKQDLDLAQRIIHTLYDKETSNNLLPMLTWFRKANLQTYEVPILSNQIQQPMDRPKFKPEQTQSQTTNTLCRERKKQDKQWS